MLDKETDDLWQVVVFWNDGMAPTSGPVLRWSRLQNWLKGLMQANKAKIAKITIVRV